MFLWSLIYQQRVFKRYHSDKHFSQIFFLQDGGQNQLNKITSLSPYVYVFLGCIYKSDSLDAGASGAAGRANVALCPARSFLIIYAKRSCVEQLPASDSVVGRAYTAWWQSRQRELLTTQHESVTTPRSLMTMPTPPFLCPESDSYSSQENKVPSVM